MAQLATTPNSKLNNLQTLGDDKKESMEQAVVLVVVAEVEGTGRVEVVRVWQLLTRLMDLDEVLEAPEKRHDLGSTF